MAKVILEKYPMGSYPGQRSPGMFINDGIEHSINILAKNIQKDMQFVGLYTGDGTVRNGKSSCAQQHATYYSWKISQLIGKEIPFTNNNIVFRSEKLIEKAFQVPRYSCIILDEGDDLTAHYFSKLATQLKKFFRKCGQLNLFIILILPDFFELPANYALIRSNFLVNVHFLDEFERGFFKFYGPKAKKNLYLHGKKWKDYDAWAADFPGKFIHLYTVDEEVYRRNKYEDMMLEEKEEVPVNTQLREKLIEYVTNAREILPEVQIKTWCKVFNTTRNTIYKYLKKNTANTDISKEEVLSIVPTYNNITLNDEENILKDGVRNTTTLNENGDD